MHYIHWPSAVSPDDVQSRIKNLKQSLGTPYSIHSPATVMTCVCKREDKRFGGRRMPATGTGSAKRNEDGVDHV